MTSKTLRSLFLTVFTSCAHDAEIPLSKTGLSDFLDFDSPAWSSPYGIAGAALIYFCTDGHGRYNGCSYAVTAVLQFLIEATGNALPADKHLKNLHRRMMRNASVEDIASWARGAFPSN